MSTVSAGTRERSPRTLSSSFVVQLPIQFFFPSAECLRVARSSVGRWSYVAFSASLRVTDRVLARSEELSRSGSFSNFTGAGAARFRDCRAGGWRPSVPALASAASRSRTAFVSVIRRYRRIASVGDSAATDSSSELSEKFSTTFLKPGVISLAPEMTSR